MTSPNVTHTGIDLRPNHARVITRFFVPGLEALGRDDSRAGPVIDRIMALAESEVEAAMAHLQRRFQFEGRELERIFVEHAGLVMSRVDPELELSPVRQLLLGASFTHEFAIEGAALCNPSAVLHPVQDGSGAASFIFSVRGIGEGHRSSIGFRTGRVSATGSVTVDPAGTEPVAAPAQPGVHHGPVLHAKLSELHDDRENASYVLDVLPARFEADELDVRIGLLDADAVTRSNTAATIDNIRRLARSSYRVEFNESIELSNRVLWPHSPAESHGMEDARFVRFVEPDGEVVYYATYTAYDGVDIAQHLLETSDFLTFDVSPMAGAAASGKGFALFPRKIGGQYAALSRSDRENNSIAFSDDVRCWDRAEVIQVPKFAWEILQLGNCGSPIETDAGWIVFTHGVGPMRTYSLGALLLDLEHPSKVLGFSSQPILEPAEFQRGGYVPNVVYTCGGFIHGDTLVLPYGVDDQTITIATYSVEDLVASLLASA